MYSLHIILYRTKSGQNSADEEFFNVRMLADTPEGDQLLLSGQVRQEILLLDPVPGTTSNIDMFVIDHKEKVS